VVEGGASECGASECGASESGPGLGKRGQARVCERGPPVWVQERLMGAREKVVQVVEGGRGQARERGTQSPVGVRDSGYARENHQ
jgi:hypothetical protein